MTLAVLGVGAAVGAAVVVYGGLYNVAATEQHTQAVYSVMETAMRQSVRLRSRNIVPPALNDERMVVRGAACFRDKCVQCHGAPGVAQGDIGRSMQPLPGPLVDARQRWNARELYWVTRHGIKMSGMPAWEVHLADEDLWAVVAFLQRLPNLTPQEYAAYAKAAQPVVASDSNLVVKASCGPGAPTDFGPGDMVRGRKALYQYACSACHTIPGITGSSPNVGPPLAGMAGRTMIGGKLANTPDNMVLWLRRTHSIDPQTAMPEMGVTEQDARNIAAYLATLN